MVVELTGPPASILIKSLLISSSEHTVEELVWGIEIMKKGDLTPPLHRPVKSLDIVKMCRHRHFIVVCAVETCLKLLIYKVQLTGQDRTGVPGSL